jgi:glucose-1-phosphate cytidylyltransferase
MKVIILAGGFGTRISEYSKSIPKPMNMIGNRPLIWHIMNIYSKYNFKEFIIALGYKGKIIREYFNKQKLSWKVELVDTGMNTLTGGRIKRLKKYIQNETFMLTYGDGLSNINFKKLLAFHNKNKKKVTVTAVRPPARFGALKISKNLVTNFREKSSLDVGWVNGGFFVMEPDFLKYINNDKTVLEEKPLETLAQKRELAAFKHEGFWQCMDTKRDLDLLRHYWKKRSKKFF